MRREDLENLLLSFKEEDFYLNADLHLHSCYSDGNLEPCEIVNKAKEANKKYISITDHNTIDAYLATNIMANDNIISGVEFDCYYKNCFIHILGYGINIDNSELRSLCSASEMGRKHNIYRLFHLRNAQDAIQKINNAGGIAVLAHPACYLTNNLDEMVSNLVRFGLRGIEVYYPYKGIRGLFKFHSRKTIIDIAEKYNLIKTGGSDTHGKNLL